MHAGCRMYDTRVRCTRSVARVGRPRPRVAWSTWGIAQLSAERTPSKCKRQASRNFWNQLSQALVPRYQYRYVYYTARVYILTCMGNSGTRRKMIFRSIPQWYMGNRIGKGTRLRANREEAILYNPLSLHTSLCSPLSVFSASGQEGCAVLCHCGLFDNGHKALCPLSRPQNPGIMLDDGAVHQSKRLALSFPLMYGSVGAEKIFLIHPCISSKRTVPARAAGD